MPLNNRVVTDVNVVEHAHKCVAGNPASRSTAFQSANADWTNLQEMAGEQRTLSQQMTKEFFYIAQGMHVKDHQVSLKEAMDEFEVHENCLIYGDEACPFHGTTVKIVAPPTITILPGLQAVKAEWDTLKTYLAEALKATTPDLSTIDHVTLGLLWGSMVKSDPSWFQSFHWVCWLHYVVCMCLICSISCIGCIVFH
jgi:hypothetical protein